MRRSYPVHTGERSPYWSSRAGRVFYVSVMDGRRKGVLLGPYETHREALDNVAQGRELANEADPRASFYAFGTCSAPEARSLRTVFGR
jgi:hypothetical protein